MSSRPSNPVQAKRNLLVLQTLTRRRRLFLANCSSNDEPTDDDSNNGNSQIAQKGNKNVSKRKDKILIQGVKNNVMKHYKQMENLGYVKEDTLHVKKSMKIRTAGLVTNLKSLKGMCESKELRTGIDGVVVDVENMFPGGGARMFTSHNSGIGGKLEFVCVAVYKYEINGQEACDYIMAHFSHKNRPSNRISSFWQKQCSPDELRDRVEASFIYELVGRKYAKLENSQLYMITED
ncbi:unnamed protein product [Auanema sp. JU1783]|nr:unnamed protein product [Auanema sp. JU1783]